MKDQDLLQDPTHLKNFQSQLTNIWKFPFEFTNDWIKINSFEQMCGLWSMTMTPKLTGGILMLYHNRSPYELSYVDLEHEKIHLKNNNNRAP